jgi:hypothetical protein
MMGLLDNVPDWAIEKEYLKRQLWERGNLPQKAISALGDDLIQKEHDSRGLLRVYDQKTLLKYIGDTKLSLEYSARELQEENITMDLKDFTKKEIIEYVENNNLIRTVPAEPLNWVKTHISRGAPNDALLILSEYIPELNPLVDNIDVRN